MSGLPTQYPTIMVGKIAEGMNVWHDGRFRRVKAIKGVALNNTDEMDSIKLEFDGASHATLSVYSTLEYLR